MTKKINIIINPASGLQQPILNRINDIFHPAEVQWSVSITLKSGDAMRFAKQAIIEGVNVVCVYGGDGTVMEVAHAVQGGDTPMAILPGGTANLMSVELGIPKDLAKAAQIAIDPNSSVRRVDMGQTGEQRFMLRMGIGFAGEKVKLADRDLKEKWGILAYSIAGLKALENVPIADYRITIDGEEYETKGMTCLIDNAGNIGVQGMSPAKNISVSDGLLDVIVVCDSGVGSLMAVGGEILGLDASPDAIKHWQGRDIRVECDPPQAVQCDGEIWGDTPVTATVLPGVLPILTPSIEQHA